MTLEKSELSLLSFFCCVNDNEQKRGVVLCSIAYI